MDLGEKADFQIRLDGQIGDAFGDGNTCVTRMKSQIGSIFEITTCGLRCEEG